MSSKMLGEHWFFAILLVVYSIVTMLSFVATYDFCYGDPFGISNILYFQPNFKFLCAFGIIEGGILILFPIILGIFIFWQKMDSNKFFKDYEVIS